MKLVNVLQWVTDRGSSGGSPTRPKPAGGSVENPACVWGNPGCEARGKQGDRPSIEPRNLNSCGHEDNPAASATGESRRFACSGRQQSSFARGGAARIPPGSENSACLYRGDLGTREIQHSPQRCRSKGNRVINVPGLADWRPLAPARSEERGGEEVPEGEATSRSPRDGVLEVLAEHSTDGRTTGWKPGRSGRRGSETQATRCREGEAGHNALTEGNRGDT